MNWVDLAVIVFVVAGVAIGAREGLSCSGFGLLAFGAAFLGAAWLYPDSLTGFVLTFALVVLAGIVAAKLLGRWFKASGLGWLDRAMGAALGLVNTALLVVIAVVLCLAYGPKAPRRDVAHSKAGRYGIEAARGVSDALPETMKARVESAYQELVASFPPEVREKAPSLGSAF